MIQLERDPVFKVSDQHDQTLPQIRKRAMEKIVKLAHYIATEPISVFKVRMELIGLLDPATYTRIGVHYGLFFSTLSGQATTHQLNYWVGKGALSLNGIIGCFAMTELGHVIHRILPLLLLTISSFTLHPFINASFNLHPFNIHPFINVSLSNHELKLFCVNNFNLLTGFKRRWFRNYRYF